MTRAWSVAVLAGMAALSSSSLGAIPVSSAWVRHVAPVLLSTLPTPSQPEKKADKPEPTSKPTPDTKPATEPTADELVKDMEKKAGPRPASTPASPSSTPAAPTTQPGTGQPVAVPAPGSTRLLREGSFLVSRRGRVIRAASGEWLYAFDSDSQGVVDPTMVLMPCADLQAMEKLAERYGEAATFTVTGEVFVYHNKNYLLPRKFQVNRPSGDLKSGQ